MFKLKSDLIKQNDIIKWQSDIIMEKHDVIQQ